MIFAQSETGMLCSQTGQTSLVLIHSTSPCCHLANKVSCCQANRLQSSFSPSNYKSPVFISPLQTFIFASSLFSSLDFLKFCLKYQTGTCILFIGLMFGLSQLTTCDSSEMVFYKSVHVFHIPLRLWM